jgi:predicted MFS family arabinose efflux permease
MPSVLWPLLFGNFVIGTGVMTVPGTLNDISSSLAISVATAGQLITAGAVLMAWARPCAPPWWRAGTAAGCWRCPCSGTRCCTWPARSRPASPPAAAARAGPAGPAIFTPQAAACVGLLVPPEQRGRAITFIFLGWSVASVLGMPIAAFVGGTLGWRSAFGVVAVLSVVARPGCGAPCPMA